MLFSLPSPASGNHYSTLISNEIDFLSSSYEGM